MTSATKTHSRSDIAFFSKRKKLKKEKNISHFKSFSASSVAPFPKEAMGGGGQNPLFVGNFYCISSIITGIKQMRLLCNYDSKFNLLLLLLLFQFCGCCCCDMSTPIINTISEIFSLQNDVSFFDCPSVLRFSVGGCRFFVFIIFTKCVLKFLLIVISLS